MPIAVRDFEWQQSEQMVYVTVPLKGVSRNKVDILSTEVYIKVSGIAQCLFVRRAVRLNIDIIRTTSI